MAPPPPTSSRACRTSRCRRCSANSRRPSKSSSKLTQADRLFLARHDSDPFNRWQSLQDVAMALLLGAVGNTPWAASDIDALGEALADTIASPGLDPAFKALTLGIPSESLVAQTIGANVDPDRIRAVRLHLIAEVGRPARADAHGRLSQQPVERRLCARHRAVRQARAEEPGAWAARRRRHGGPAPAWRASSTRRQPT